MPLSTSQWLSVLLLPVAAQAAISWGSASPQTYQMRYDPAIFGNGPAGSLQFCQKWRIACINYVGARNYHHVVNCGADEKGPVIFNVCAALQKDEEGNWTGSKTPCDFTEQVIGTIGGVSITAQPASPYAQCQDGGAPGANTDTAPVEPTTSTTTPPSTTATTAATETALTDAAQDTTSTTSTTLLDEPTSADPVVVASTTVFSSASFSAVAVAAGPTLSGSNNPFVPEDDSSPAARPCAAPLALLAGLLASLLLL